MATTKIWAVKERLRQLINYVCDLDKTAERETSEALRDLVGYDADESKTEQRLYVTGIGCTPENALAVMNKNLTAYPTDSDRVAYHAYQSFAEGEVDPSTAHAIGIAFAIELFTDGSLNTFAQQTNVNTRSRFICYDIHELGKQLMPIGMLVVLDSILNRITENRAKGRKTYIFIDEIYLLFQHDYSANFLFTMWKKVRKYGAFITGITQNCEDLLQSHTARTMLANSELVIMLNQAATDREQLAELMGISDLQMSYITNVEAGHGLVKIGGALVPFVNNFPKDTRLYKLCTTKPGE